MIMVTSGVATLSIADHAKEQITDRWDKIRVLLPPTFAGKYDKYQFTLFVESNLYLMGYAAVIFGNMLGLQAYAAIILRAKLKQDSVRDKQENEKVGIATLRCSSCCSGWMFLLRFTWHPPFICHRRRN
jgi:hypothetical protein